MTFAVLVVLLSGTSAKDCSNPLFSPDFAPPYLANKFAELALLETPKSQEKSDMCFNGQPFDSCCSDTSYAMMRSVLNAQRVRIQLAKDRLAFMPDPAWFLNSTMELILGDVEDGGFVESAGVSREDAEKTLSPLFTKAGTVTEQVKTITSNAESCTDAILDFEAGMLCMACSADHESFVSVGENNTLTIKLTDSSRRVLMEGCCELVRDMAKLMDSAQALKEELVQAAANLSVTEHVTFLSSVDFPNSSLLHLACPAVGASSSSTAASSTASTQAAEQVLSYMVAGVEEPRLQEGFRPESFLPKGISSAALSPGRRLKCRAVRGSGATDKWCRTNCNYVPRFCPRSHCTCRVRRRRKTQAARRRLTDSSSSGSDSDSSDSVYEEWSASIVTLWFGDGANATSASAYDPIASSSSAAFEMKPFIDQELAMYVLLGASAALCLAITFCFWYRNSRDKAAEVTNAGGELDAPMGRDRSQTLSAGYYLPDFRYDLIEASASTAGNFALLWVNYARCLLNGLHVKRALWTDDLIEDVSSPSERDYLEEKEGVTGAMVTARNMLVWRRSMMVVLILPTLATALYSVYPVQDAYDDYYAMKARVETLRPLYSSPLALAEARLAGSFTNVTTTGSASDKAYTQAQALYDNFNAMDPTTDVKDFVTATLQQSLESMYVDVKRVQMWLSIVQSALVWVSFVTSLLALVRWTKYTVSRGLLGIGWFCLFAAPFIISIVPIRYFMNLDGYYLTDEWIDEVFSPEFLGFSGTSGGVLISKPMAKQQLRNTKFLAALMVGLVNALSVFAKLLPAALALAPAGIRVSLAVKKLVPEAALPPVVTMLIPLLSTPLTWSMYNIILQLIGDQRLLAALIILSYAPILYMVFIWKEELFRPMPADKLVRIMSQYSWYMFALNLMAVGFLVLFITRSSFSEDLKPLILDLDLVAILRSFPVTPSYAFILLVKSGASYLYMTAVGTDFLFEVLSTLRKYQLYLAPKEKRTKLLQHPDLSVSFPSSCNTGLSDSERAQVQVKLEHKLDQIFYMCHKRSKVGKGITSMLGEGLQQATKLVRLRNVSGRVRLTCELTVLSPSEPGYTATGSKSYRLEVVVEEAAGLSPKDIKMAAGSVERVLTADPYVRLQLKNATTGSATLPVGGEGSKGNETSVAQKTLAPKWGQRFVFSPVVFSADADMHVGVRFADGMALHLEVVDRDTHRELHDMMSLSDDYMGEAELALAELLRAPGQKVDQWLDLVSTHDDEVVTPKGTVKKNPLSEEAQRSGVEMTQITSTSAATSI